MNLQEYIDKQKKICEGEWFRNHQAKIIAGGGNPQEPVTVIAWQNPENWNYGCRFIIHRRWLVVVGDIGEATYEWGQNLTLDFVSKLDFTYFHSKCRASETGFDYFQWDSKFAFQALKEAKKEAKKQEEDEAWILEVEDLHDESPEDEFESKLHEAYFKGLDAETASGIMEAGRKPHIRAIGHWVGITMAAKQLQEVAP